MTLTGTGAGLGWGHVCTGNSSEYLLTCRRRGSQPRAAARRGETAGHVQLVSASQLPPVLPGADGVGRRLVGAVDGADVAGLPPDRDLALAGAGSGGAAHSRFLAGRLGRSAGGSPAATGTDLPDAGASA